MTSFNILSNMIVSNDNISYENSWEKLKSISEPSMLIVAIIHLGKLFFQLGEKEVFSPLGIGVNEFEALFIIKHKKQPTPTIISKTILVQPTKITRVLDKLEKLKAIVRKPINGDRRSYYLSLTDTGENLIKKATELFKESSLSLSEKIGIENIRMMSQFIVGIIYDIGEE